MTRPAQITNSFQLYFRIISKLYQLSNFILTQKLYEISQCKDRRNIPSRSKSKKSHFYMKNMPSSASRDDAMVEHLMNSLNSYKARKTSQELHKLLIHVSYIC